MKTKHARSLALILTLRLKSLNLRSRSLALTLALLFVDTKNRSFLLTYLLPWCSNRFYQRWFLALLTICVTTVVTCTAALCSDDIVYQTTLKEEDRLAAVIADIDHEVKIVPRGAYVQSPKGQIYENRSFAGTLVLLLLLHFLISLSDSSLICVSDRKGNPIQSSL